MPLPKRWKAGARAFRCTGRISADRLAQIIGDLLAAATDIALFFAITVGLISLMLYLYCRCWRSTAVNRGDCLLTVACQLGSLHLFGFVWTHTDLGAVPGIFAIGISHAEHGSIQRDGAWRHAAGCRAQHTFRALFIPGTTALLADVVGFITLLVIDIGVIQQLAITASIGVFVAIFTKMFLPSGADVPDAGIGSRLA
ncbi:hypothetical protein ACU8WE_18535 [Pseudomonas parakoreensis]